MVEFECPVANFAVLCYNSLINVVVCKPQLIHQNRFLDFGFGFYTTTNRAQAIAFADKVFQRRCEGGKIVNIYELDEQTLEALKIRKLYNQLVLTSEKALSYLKFAGTVPEGDL